MKPLIFLYALLLPALLHAQNNGITAMHIQKPGHCVATIAGKYHDKDTVPLTDLLNASCVTVDCGTVLSIDMSIPLHGIYVEYHFFDGCFLMYLGELQEENNYSYIIVERIQYKSADGQIHNARGLTIRVKK